jgi:hypothetical protein
VEANAMFVVVQQTQPLHQKNWLNVPIMGIVE